MTAYIAHIRFDPLRKLLWLLWFPVLYVELQIKLWNSPRLDDWIWTCWDMGWIGLKSK